MRILAYSEIHHSISRLLIRTLVSVGDGTDIRINRMVLYMLVDTNWRGEDEREEAGFYGTYDQCSVCPCMTSHWVLRQGSESRLRAEGTVAINLME